MLRNIWILIEIVLISSETKSSNRSQINTETLTQFDIDLTITLQNEDQFPNINKSVSTDLNLNASIDGNTTNKINTKQTFSNTFDWTNYYPLDHIYKWMNDLLLKYPEHLTPIVAGSSYEKRKILGIRLSKKVNNTGVFIEGGMHAREWISPATVTFILNELLTSNDSSVQKIAENYDWYIVPVVNPDGYIYSHTKDRMWRKNRKPYGSFVGVDLNRNWDHRWGQSGTSMNASDDNFGGSHPFSEIETETLSKYLISLRGKIQVYLLFHSYFQKILFPYGYTGERVKNYDDLLLVGNAAATSLAKRYGSTYDVGSINEIIFPVSGSSLDWAYDNINTKIAFGYELRPNDGDKVYGFVLPPEQIIPTGEETLDSIVTLLDEATKLGYFKK